jgi:hypothetical protein
MISKRYSNSEFIRPVLFGLLLSAFAGTPALAEETHPCKKLTAACKAAGYHPGQHQEGKGLHADCMKKLLDGATVAGVTVEAADVSACKAKKAKKGARKNDMPKPNDATSTD